MPPLRGERHTGFCATVLYNKRDILVIPDSTYSIEETITQMCLKEQVHEVVGNLPEKEQRVICLRFGLDDGRGRTLEEVGKEFNVTRERIRQIESNALRKMRHQKTAKILKDYMMN